MQIDGLEFKLAKVNLSTISKIERMGVPWADFEKKPVAFFVGLVAVSAGLTFEQAADHIQNHIDVGGDVGELLDAVTKAVQSADTRGL